jgi:hypothetical protein
MNYDAGGRLSSLADNLRTYVSSVGYQGSKSNSKSKAQLDFVSTQPHKISRNPCPDFG